MTRRQEDAAKRWFWREVLARQRQSGLSIRDFCRREALAEPSFFWWRRKLAVRKRKRRADASGPPVARFARIKVTPLEQDGKPPLVIVLAGGVRIRVQHGADARLLGEVLAALEGRPC